jgi:hypothetical protein
MTIGGTEQLERIEGRMDDLPEKRIGRKPYESSEACGEPRLIKTWLAKFSANSGESVGEAVRDLWLESFAHLLNTVFEAACKRTLETFVYPRIPTIADVLSHVEKAEGAALTLEAEESWRRVLRLAEQGSWCDVEPTPQEKQAAKMVGGLNRIEECETDKDLKWLRIDFLKAFVRVRELEQNPDLLPESKAKEILARITAGTRETEPKQLAPAASDREPVSAEDIREAQRQFGELREKLGPPPAPAPPRRKLAIAPHTPPPENSANTPEGQAFREWARLYDRGETDLFWPDYKQQKLTAVCV